MLCPIAAQQASTAPAWHGACVQQARKISSSTIFFPVSSPFGANKDAAACPAGGKAFTCATTQ